MTALYPLSLVVTNSGNIVSISWAITPISCPLLPCMVFSSSSDSGIQSKHTPFICFTLSTAHGIGLIFSFNLLSDEAYATISLVAVILPAVLLIGAPVPTPNDPVITNLSVVTNPDAGR